MISFSKVVGRVTARPGSNFNKNMETGEIEICVEDFAIIEADEGFTGEVKEACIARYKKEVEEKKSNEVTTSKEVVPSEPLVNKYAERSHNCGEISENNIGEEVTLVGWLEFQRMKKFLTIRDGYGCTQVRDENQLLNSFIVI